MISLALMKNIYYEDIKKILIKLKKRKKFFSFNICNALLASNGMLQVFMSKKTKAKKVLEKLDGTSS